RRDGARHLARPLVPRPHRDAHPRRRGELAVELLHRQLPGVRGGQASAARRGGREAEAHPLQADRPMREGRVRTAPVSALALALACAHAPGGAAPAAAPRLYVSNEVSNDVSVVDTATDAVVATIPVGNRPRGLRGSPDGRLLYV